MTVAVNHEGLHSTYAAHRVARQRLDNLFAGWKDAEREIAQQRWRGTE